MGGGSGGDGGEPQDPLPPPLRPAWCVAPGEPLRHCGAQGRCREAAKGEKRMNRSSWRGPRAPRGGAARAAAAGTITCTSVTRTGGPLRPRCSSPPRRHPQLRNNSRRERVRLRASEGQAGVPPRPRACIGSPEGQSLVPLPALERLADAPRAWSCSWILVAGEGNPQHRSPEGLHQKKQPLSRRERCIRVPLEWGACHPASGLWREID